MIFIERYFPDIPFTSLPPVVKENNVTGNKGSGIGQAAVQTTVEIPEYQAQFRHDVFSTTRIVLDEMEYVIGARISTEGRMARFVPKEDLVPQDPQEQFRLMQTFGEGYLENAAGDCTRLSKDLFAIRLGFAGRESITPFPWALSVTGHEIGHTIGDHAGDPLNEELKAFAFEQLFMGVYLRQLQGIDGVNPESLHDVARNRLAQLTSRGINETAIISHLIDQPFGYAQPYDYQRLRV